MRQLPSALRRGACMIWLSQSLGATPAFAFGPLMTQMHVGRRWFSQSLTTSSTQALQGSETVTRLHVQTLPALSLGLAYSLLQPRTSSLGLVAETASLSALSVEGLLRYQSSPLTAVHLRAHYPFLAHLVVQDLGAPTPRTYEVGGLEIGVGISYKIAPIVSLTAEVGRASHSISGTQSSPGDGPGAPTSWQVSSYVILGGVDVVVDP